MADNEYRNTGVVPYQAFVRHVRYGTPFADVFSLIDQILFSWEVVTSGGTSRAGPVTAHRGT